MTSNKALAGRRALLIASAGLLAAPRIPAAQGAWPGSTPVTIILPYAPGGATDVVGRLVLDGLTQRIGGTFVWEHRPGASTSLAARHVARARPDGHTLLLGTIATFTMTPIALRNPGFDPLTDFEHVTQVCATQSLLVGHPRWGSLQQMVEAAKARPGQLSYATWGVGTTAHLPMLLFMERAGIEMLHVPYNGAPPALTDTIAGRTDCMFALVAACRGHVEGGRLKGLGAASEERVRIFPDIPTLGEQGFPIVNNGWYSIQAPVGTPAPIRARILEAMTAHFAEPRVIEFMAGQGLAPEQPGEAPLRERIARELAQNRVLMARAGVVAE
ncbi:MAG TPA: tripartite tricarboxylate transporter substrate binding protein [Acetobacteraceae bacterium]|nr:tripartite tricarboxylate transporter substrate binding protein [Acetobacteraceae bacterium]